MEMLTLKYCDSALYLSTMQTFYFGHSLFSARSCYPPNNAAAHSMWLRLEKVQFLRLVDIEAADYLRSNFHHLANTAVMSIPNLTFGIELEFICLRPEDLFEKLIPASADGCAGSVLFRELINEGIPSTGWEEDDEIADNAPSHSRWRVESDELILSKSEEELLPEGWAVEAIELSSRKLHFFFDDWRHEVAKVLKLLRRVEEYGCRFITNKSTGFHVHVGHNTKRIPLSVAKNVFQLVTAFERCFDELHPVHRIVYPKPIFFGHAYYPPSFFHTFGATYDAAKGEKSSPLLNRLANIEAVRSYDELGAFVQGRPARDRARISNQWP